MVMVCFGMLLRLFVFCQVVIPVGHILRHIFATKYIRQLDHFYTYLIIQVHTKIPISYQK